MIPVGSTAAPVPCRRPVLPLCNRPTWLPAPYLVLPWCLLFPLRHPPALPCLAGSVGSAPAFRLARVASPGGDVVHCALPYHARPACNTRGLLIPPQLLVLLRRHLPEHRLRNVGSVGSAITTRCHTGSASLQDYTPASLPTLAFRLARLLQTLWFLRTLPCPLTFVPYPLALCLWFPVAFTLPGLGKILLPLSRKAPLTLQLPLFPLPPCCLACATPLVGFPFGYMPLGKVWMQTLPLLTCPGCLPCICCCLSFL